MKETDKDKSYAFLLQAVENAISRDRSSRNMADREAVLKLGQTYMTAAPAAGGGPGGVRGR